MKKLTMPVAILALLLAAVLLVGCGSGGSTSDSSTSPEAVAKAFWVAAMKHDAKATWNMFSSTVKSSLGNDIKQWESKMFTNTPGATITAGKATVSPNAATVPVKISSGGKEVYSTDVSLVKENGVWKVEIP
jgi:hypothetical protein